MKISHKLILSFICIALLVFTVAIVGIKISRNTQSNFDKIAFETIPIIQILEQIKFSGLRIVSSTCEYGFLHTEKDYYRANLTSAPKINLQAAYEEDQELKTDGVKSFEDSVRQYFNLVSTFQPEQKKTVTATIQAGKALIDISNQIFALKEQGVKGEAILILKDEFEQSEKNFLNVVNNTIKEQKQTFHVHKNKFLQDNANDQRMIVIFSAFIFLLAVTIGILLSQTIAKPFVYFKEKAEAIGKGDFNTTIEIHSNDEIGALAAAFNKMTQDLKQSMEIEKGLMATTAAANAAAEAEKKKAGELERAIGQRDTEIIERKKAEQNLKQHIEIQELINSVLHLFLNCSNLEDSYAAFIDLITANPCLGVEQKGVIALIEGTPPAFSIKAQKGFSDDSLISCASVPFGKCLCGNAAATKKILYGHCQERNSGNTDPENERIYCCVPLVSSANETIGIINLVMKDDSGHNPLAEEALKSIANIIAGTLEKIHAEKAFLASDEKYKAISNTANDAIMMADPQGKLTYANPAAEKMFGYSQEEMLGRDIHAIVAPTKYHAHIKEGIRSFAATGRGDAIGKTLELYAVNKEGNEFPVELSLSAMHMDNEWHAVGMVRDISERKKAEEDKANLFTQVRKSQKMEALGTLAGGIAHDFNNILAAILGYASLAKRHLNDSEKFNTDMDQILSAGQRAKDLVHQILAFSRQSEHDSTPIQAFLIAKEALKLLRNSIPSSITIQQDIDPNSGVIMADPSQIHQIIMNLCTNAYQAMHQNGGTLTVTLTKIDLKQPLQVTIGSTEPGEYMKIAVSDTGIGMDKLTLERIFEPYFTSKEQGAGTGLGLSVVHGIVANLKGGITVESTLGKGSVFTVYLPTVPQDVQTDESLQSLDQLPRGTENILFVDDELPLVELGKEMLTDLGYRITARTSSMEALEVFRRKNDQYDLIITDQMMPNMTGINLAKEIIQIRPDIPIILITGFSDILSLEQAKHVGIRRILKKPTILKEVAEVIRDVLDKRRS